jgi:uncharacterized membrane protein YhaH (DUF805 family)
MNNNNIYLELELFLDPAITNTNALKAELNKKITEWNKLSIADAKYKHFVQIARAWQQNPQNYNLTKLAAEARAIREQHGKDAVEIYEEDGILEPREYESLHKEFLLYFTKATIDSWLHLEVSQSLIPPEPQYSPEVKKKILSKNDMDKIASDLKIILGNENANLYDLIGISPQSNLTTIQTKKQAAYDAAFKKPKTGSDSAKIDMKIQLLGRANVIFATDISRQGYDIALKRRPFDKLIDTKFRRRTIKGSITYEDYQKSVDDLLQSGFSQQESEWYVYEFYCKTSKFQKPKPPTKPPVITKPPIDFKQAIQQSNFATIKQWLKTDTNLLHTKDQYGETPLHWAVKNKSNIEIVKYLIGQGTDINAKDNNNVTPLHRATRLNVEIVKYLIEQGANINATTISGNTPLHWAAWNNSNSEIIRYLISREATVNAPNNDGVTLAKITEKIFSWKGRARRKEFWWFFLCYYWGISVIIGLSIGIILAIMHPYYWYPAESFAIGNVAGWILVSVLFSPLIISISIRRMHDVGRSGWWFLINCFFGIGTFVFLIECMIDSQKGSNKYGPNPKGIN